MLWVRFPNGQCVQYNQATYVARSQFGYTDLYTKRDGNWIAQVPNECIIENEFACRVSNPIAAEGPWVDELKRIGRKLDRAMRVKRS